MEVKKIQAKFGTGPTINASVVKDSIISLQKIKLKNAGVCTKRKCVTSIESRLPPIHRPNSREEEEWAVRALPADWNPVSKPSKVVQNLLEKRQNEHKTIIDSIKKKFEAINLDIEAQIRLKAEALKRNSSGMKEEVDKIIETLNVEEGLLALQKEDFKKVEDRIIELYQDYINKIKQFYIFLQDIERLRANKFKGILRDAYVRLQKISYHSPYELQQYFENEILRINQIIMSNLRCYAELQLQLNLQAENNNRLQMQRFQRVRMKWKNIKKKDILLKLNEQQLMLANPEALLLKTEHGRDASKLFTAKEHNMERMWTKLTPLPITSTDVNIWSRKMQHTVDGLDDCARKLITVYKTAIVQVFNGYFEELQHLTENMLEMGLIDSSEISMLSLDICKPCIQHATQQYNQDLSGLEDLWESIITHLQDKLQTTYVFLHTAAHLWDSHFDRLAEAQRIVLKDLFNAIKKNDKATQDQEINLNIQLDILRQAPNKGKLEEAFHKVNGLLDTLQKIYNSHYESETKIVEKYEDLISQESDVLKNELKLFLHIHPKESEMDPTVQRKRASQDSETKENQTWILPHQMRQCEYQVDAVRNWMFGLWEAIEKYISTCREEMLQQASLWCSERTKKLAKRLEVKLAFHTSRYARVKIDIYDCRLAELKNHLDILERHKAGAEKEIQSMEDFWSTIEKANIEALENYNKKVSNINAHIDPSTNSSALRGYIGSVTAYAKANIKKLTDLTEEQKGLCEQKLYEIQEASIKLIKSMK